MTARWLWVAASVILGLGLVFALLASLSVAPGDVVAALASAPLWLWLAVGVTAFLNQVVGALKWRFAAHHLSEASSGRPDLARAIELTGIGEFFGQFVPVQLSTLAARWLLQDRAARDAGHVVRATLFEQAFDLILVFCGAVAGLAILLFGVSPGTGGALMVAALALCLLVLRPILAGSAAIMADLSARGVFPRHSTAARDGFWRAAQAPFGVVLTMGLFSLVRIVLVALRAVLVFVVFAPGVVPWVVIVASPGVTLLSALPIAPAGLGVAEWSWSAVLVFAGSNAPAAALAALNLRLINMVVVGVIVAGLSLPRLAFGERVAVRGHSS